MFEPSCAVPAFLGTDTTYQPTYKRIPAWALPRPAYRPLPLSKVCERNFVYFRAPSLRPHPNARSAGPMSVLPHARKFEWLANRSDDALDTKVPRRLFLEARTEAAVCVACLASRRSCPAGNVFRGAALGSSSYPRLGVDPRHSGPAEGTCIRAYKYVLRLRVQRH